VLEEASKSWRKTTPPRLCASGAAALQGAAAEPSQCAAALATQLRSGCTLAKLRPCACAKASVSSGPSLRARACSSASAAPARRAVAHEMTSAGGSAPAACASTLSAASTTACAVASVSVCGTATVTCAVATPAGSACGKRAASARSASGSRPSQAPRAAKPGVDARKAAASSSVA